MTMPAIRLDRSFRNLAMGVGAALLVLAGPPAVGAARSVKTVPLPKGPGSIAGIWRLEDYKSTAGPVADRIIHEVGGNLPPLLPWARDLYMKRIADNNANMPFASTTAYCLPGGMPQMMMSANYPIQILETSGQVSMIFEEQHSYRLIYLNERQPEEVEPGFYGHSVGRWEGNTLVVDTVGLNDRLTLDLLGMPQSESMHVIERIRRIAPGKLEDLIAIDDPKVFSRPWSIRKTYQSTPKDRVREYICENNRNTPQDGGLTFRTEAPAAGK
jgi:hypothetical protein